MFEDELIMEENMIIGHKSLECTGGTCCFGMSDYFYKSIIGVMSPVFGT